MGCALRNAIKASPTESFIIKMKTAFVLAFAIAQATKLRSKSRGDSDDDEDYTIAKLSSKSGETLYRSEIGLREDKNIHKELSVL
jgi:hypothetical protein